MKAKFRGFDRALEKMFKDKVSMSEFENLKQNLDGNRAKTIFNDMKELFEVTSKEFKF